MAYSCKVLADSITVADHRLTTLEVTYPRIVHAEFMTHRAFSRNAASTRAIPFNKAVEKIEKDLFVPIVWPKNGPGMVAVGELDLEAARKATAVWEEAAAAMMDYARQLNDLEVHKSISGRLLECFGWITVIVTATEWENFFHLRTASDAELHIQKIAVMMEELYRASRPRLITSYDLIPWHLPLIRDEDYAQHEVGELSTNDLIKMSVGRAARVSYLTHGGKRDPSEDIRLHDQLLNNGHWSPFEHVATPKHMLEQHEYSGNLRGWDQYRKRFPDENYPGLGKRVVQK